MADEPVDELDVELARLPDDREGDALPVADRVRPVVGQPGEARHGRSGRGRVPDADGRQRVLVATEQPVGGEDLEPGVGGRDEHDHHPGALGSPCLGRVGDGRLVAVVAVGDQQLPARRTPRRPPRPAPARASCPRWRGRARDPARQREGRRRRGGRSARAGPARRAAAAAGSPSAPRGCARAGARRRSRTARRAATPRGRRGAARPRPGRRSPGSAPTRPARRRGRVLPRRARPGTAAPPRPRSRSGSGGRRCGGHVRGSRHGPPASARRRAAPSRPAVGSA